MQVSQQNSRFPRLKIPFEFHEPTDRKVGTFEKVGVKASQVPVLFIAGMKKSQKLLAA